MNPMHPPRWWLAVSAGVIMALLTACLGVWQLDRAAQKTAQAEQLRQRAASPPWAGPDWPCQPGASPSPLVLPPASPLPSAGPHAAPAPLPAQQPAHLRGHWVAGRTVFLDNRAMDGQPGFLVVTPLRLSEPACPGGVVLVQRGWWPRDAQDRQRLPQWLDAGGEVEVRGLVLPRLSQAYALGDEAMAAPQAQRVIRQNAEPDFWRDWLAQAPLPGALLQTQPEMQPETQPETRTTRPAAPLAGFASQLRRHWPEPDLGVDKHHGYAAQWFALSALSLGLTLWFAVIRPRTV